MALVAPFVHPHFVPELNVVFLEDSRERLEIVARSRISDAGVLVYEADENFLTRYGNVIVMGDVLFWDSREGINAWLHRIIGMSFLALSEDIDGLHDGEICWFVKSIEYSDSRDSMDIPLCYREMFGNSNIDAWVLLKNGMKVWPVRVTNNRLYKGWETFWEEHNLRTGCRVIFGVEKKWIFHIIILDENLERVYYDWPMVDEEMGALIVPSDHLITSCIPCTFINERYMFQFAFVNELGTNVNQVFTSHFEGLMLNTGVDDIYFYMCERQWIVPVINHQFHVALLDQFVKSLQLASLDLVMHRFAVTLHTKILKFPSHMLASENWDGRSEVIALAINTGGDRLCYSVVPSFIYNYGGILPLGNISRWNLKKCFVAWMESIIYHSFLRHSVEGVENCWFMKDVSAYSLTTLTTIPIGFRDIFSGDNQTIWILLKYGKKAWPVQVCNNVFLAGWANFRRAHALRPNFRLVFGCERKWIFNVFILDENNVEVQFPWSHPNPTWINLFPIPDGLVTSCIPSIFANQQSNKKFGHQYVAGNHVGPVFQGQLNEVIQENPTQQLKIRVGNFAWMVPIDNGHLHYPTFEQFIKNLDRDTLDYLFVTVSGEMELTVIVFDYCCVEKIYEWFK